MLCDHFMCSGVQPYIYSHFIICMSSPVTSHVIDNIANDHDDAVLAEPSRHVQENHGS